MTLVNVTEFVGESPQSFQAAVENAVNEASRVCGDISGIEVCNFTANVQGGRLVEYKANIKVAFTGTRKG